MNWLTILNFIKNNWGWEIPLVIVLIIFIRVKIRGFFWRARNGDELTFKEFIKSWKNGIEGSTPLQQTKITLWFMIPILVGLFYGFFATIFSKMYWLALVLFGSFPITVIQLIATWQRYKIQKKVEETMKELEEQEVKQNV